MDTLSIRGVSPGASGIRHTDASATIETLHVVQGNVNGMNSGSGHEESTINVLARKLGRRSRQPHRAGQRTVLLTGSGRGIGRATAEYFAAQGWKVGVFDIDADSVSWASGPEYVAGVIDVTSPESWEKALAQFAEATGDRLDVLVNNAGILYGTPFMEASFARDSALADVNIKGVYFGARAAFDLLRTTPGSAMVNVASASAIYGTPEMATYSSTKFAVRGITEALDQEWADKDIVVRSVWPLYVKTAMLDGVSTSGTSRQGVNLTAEDVAKKVFTAATATAPFAPVHYPVGFKTTLLYHGAHFAPARVSRALNSLLVGD